MQVKQVDIASLTPYENNPRHNERAIEKVADSIREFGWRQPIVADEAGVILVGHTRLEAAKLLGQKKVPVHVVADLSDAQKRAYRLADNRLNEYASWHDDLLAVELQELQGLGFDLRLTGFSATQLRRYTAADMTEDRLPEPPPSRTAAGDLWALGEHRLIVGDATDPDVVDRLLKDDRPHLMVTDPPYGVNYDPKWRASAGVAPTTKQHGIQNDDRADWREAWVLFPGDIAYVWHGGLHAHTVAESLRVAGFQLRAQIIWAKPKLAISRGHYHWQHEPCWIAERHEAAWYSVRQGRPAHWTGSRGETTLWEIDGEAFVSDHPTQKPIEAMARPMMNNSQPGEYVYDPFVGTGTTLIAAERTGRRCLAIDLDPEWADVAITRWESETGKQAEKL